MIKDIIFSIIIMIFSIYLSIRMFTFAKVDDYKKGAYLPSKDSGINNLFILILVISYVATSLSNPLLKLLTSVIYCIPVIVSIIISYKHYTITRKSKDLVRNTSVLIIIVLMICLMFYLK